MDECLIPFLLEIILFNSVRNSIELSIFLSKCVFSIELNIFFMELSTLLAVVEGCWQCSLCINAEIFYLHMEKDVTYTIITTPYKNISSLSYCFWFKINSLHNIILDMNEEIVLMYSGVLLKHRPQWNFRNENDLYFNFASYGNYWMLTHLRKTLNRKICMIQK